MQKLARLVLDDLHVWLQTSNRRVPQGSLTTRAIGYTLKQWDRLVGYCED